jgi:hypothetical protein
MEKLKRNFSATENTAQQSRNQKNFSHRGHRDHRDIKKNLKKDNLGHR